MADVYATPADVFTFGLAAEAFIPPQRAIASVDPSNDLIVLPAHGFGLDDQIFFVTPPTNLSTNTLPPPLTSTLLYRAIPVSFTSFKVSLTAGGAALDLTGIGAGVRLVGKDPSNDILKACEEASRSIDEALIAYSPPLVVPYPIAIVGLTARLAARRLIAAKGLANPQYAESAKMLFDLGKRDDQELARYAAGGRVAGLAVVDQTPLLDEDGSNGWSDPVRDWARAGQI